jgi:hypothetical protein
MAASCTQPMKPNWTYPAYLLLLDIVTLSLPLPITHHYVPSGNYATPIAPSNLMLLHWQYSNTVTGTRTLQTQLWQVDDCPTSNYTVTHASHAASLLALLHLPRPLPLLTLLLCVFSPALSTLHSTLTKGYFHNFPGLAARALRKHPPCSFPMVKGHLDQVRQNVQSTKPKKPVPTDTDTSNDYSPIQVDKSECTHCCYLANMEPTAQIYTDQTGKCVAPSSNGKNYQLICYDYDSNAILAVAFKN